MSTDVHPGVRPAELLRPFPYLASIGAVLFGLVHVYWLFGGSLGLPGGSSLYDSSLVPDGGSVWPLVAIDALAIPLSGLAAMLALGLDDRGASRVIRSGRRTFAATALGVILVVHAAPTIPTWGRLAFGTTDAADLTAAEQFLAFVYEPVFLAGGIAFLLAAWHHARSGRYVGAPA